MNSKMLEKLDARFCPPLIRPQMLCVYTRQFVAMLDAGMSITVALEILADQCSGTWQTRAAGKVWRSIKENIEAGATFSECLEQHPRSFSRIYIGMVRAAEACGKLVTVLDQLATFLEKSQRIRSRLTSSMIYPSAVLSVAIAVIVILVVFIVPRFVAIFSDLLEGQPLPALTAFVVDTSRNMGQYSFLALILLIVAVIAVRWAQRSEGGRLFVDQVLLHVPLLGRLVRKVLIVRFASTLATLLDSGLPALQALETLHRATSNEVMRRTILKVRDSVSEGGGFTEPLENSDLFPVIVVRWIKVGEKTAALPEMLNRLATQYEKEVDQMIDALIALIEPAMIVCLAVVVGTIVLALFMPLITIIEKIGTA
ncbi:MAG: hypothetical protein A3K19_12035 [Lentisphaerae bacterium RIFOXYB12_FULL_65_16]|nr:MAG: hypothetical protein A3K18_10195 [Lentisphaerae bacterium RIFOXYA12_64_32]OGV91083.1 MAG: hypothetical protein A3K19_12035 [Lentisphaerae bacterium RIFOXYB12_FULL_65_16]